MLFFQSPTEKQAFEVRTVLAELGDSNECLLGEREVVGINHRIAHGLVSERTERAGVIALVATLRLWYAFQPLF